MPAIWVVIAGIFFQTTVLTWADVTACEDRDSNCRRWADLGECSNNPVWMTIYCRKSCDKCRQQSGCHNKFGDDSQCQAWAADGECHNNVDWMAEYCGRACGQCLLDATESVAIGKLGQEMFLTNETHILRIGDTLTTLVHQPHGNIVALAVDANAGFMFWANNVRRTIYRANLDGTHIKSIITERVLEVNGISIDEVAGHIYWTDAQMRRIEMAQYDGANRKVIIRNGLFSPRGIIVDPKKGYVYWNDQGTKQIERARTDGSERELLVNASSVYWPNQMALSVSGNNSEDTLYWVDAWDKTIKSLHLDNSSVITEMDLTPYVRDKIVFGLVIGDNGLLYVSVWKDCNVLAVNLTDRTALWVFTRPVGDEVLFSLAVTQPKAKHNVSHSCSERARGGCSHLCIPTGGDAYRCACPSVGGLVLASDGKTCHVPEQFLLYCRADVGEVGFVVVDNATNSDAIYVVGYSSRPVGVAYDPLTQFVYWSDVQEKCIHRAHLNGTGREVFMNASTGIGYVDGLSIDWKRRKLYFTNSDFVDVDKVAYTWHKIEVIDLHTASRRSIITDVEMPRGLWVDSDNSELYYTDWGEDATVSRSSLDGIDRMILQRDVHNPNAVVVIGDRVYVIDSHFRERQRGQEVSGAAYVTDKNGTGWKHVERLHLQNPFGLAAHGDTLFVSDWGRRAIISYDTDSMVEKTLMADVSDPMGLFYVNTRIIENENQASPCSASNCESMCFESSHQVAHCACPSYGGNILGADKMSCKAATDFLLVADMFSIKMAALGNADHAVQSFATRGGTLGSVSALVFDEERQIIYYSDVNRKQIFSNAFPSERSYLVYTPSHIIDGLAYHPSSSRLYWTAYDEGVIASLHLHSNSSHREVVGGLDKPRAIALDHFRSDIYWSEVGTRPRVMRSKLDGSQSRVVLATDQLISPNGLHLDSSDETLYILDSSSAAVYKCHISLLSCSVLVTLPLASRPFFDLFVYNDFIYYSSWTDRAVSVVNRVTGQREVIVSDLVRPTQFAVYHPSDVSDYCVSGSHPCDQECSAMPGGYQCSCRQGSALMSDKQSCTLVHSEEDATTSDSTIITTNDYTTSDDTAGDVTSDVVFTANILADSEFPISNVSSDVTLRDISLDVTTAGVTTFGFITSHTFTPEETGISVTMPDVNTSDVTTSDVITSDVTTSNVTTTGAITSDVTTSDVSISDGTTSYLTTSDVTTTVVITSDVTTFDVTTSDAIMTGVTISDVATPGVNTSDVTIANVTPTSIITTDVTTSDVTTSDVITSDVTTSDVTTSDVSTSDVTTVDVTTTSIITTDVTTSNVTTFDVTTSDVTTSDVTISDVSTVDITTTIITTTDVTTSNVTTSDVTASNATTSNVTASDVTTSNATTSDVTASSSTTSDMISDAKESHTNEYVSYITEPYAATTRSLIGDDDDVNTDKTYRTSDIPTYTTSKLSKSEMPTYTTNDMSKSDIPTYTTSKLSKSEMPTYTTSDILKSDMPTHTTDDMSEIDIPTYTTSDKSKSDMPTYTTSDKSKSDVPTYTSSDKSKSDMPTYTTNDVFKSDIPTYTTSDKSKSDMPTYTSSDKSKSDMPTYTTNDVSKSDIPTYTTSDKSKSEMPAYTSDKSKSDMPTYTTSEMSKSDMPTYTTMDMPKSVTTLSKTTRPTLSNSISQAVTKGTADRPSSAVSTSSTTKLVRADLTTTRVKDEITVSATSVSVTSTNDPDGVVLVHTPTPPAERRDGAGRWSFILIIVLCVVVGCVLLVSLVVAILTARRLRRRRRGKMMLHHAEDATAPSVVRYRNPGYVAPSGDQAGNGVLPRYAVMTIPEGLHQTQSDLDDKGHGQVSNVIPFSISGRPTGTQKSTVRKYRLRNGDNAPKGTPMVQTGVYQKREPPVGTTGWQSLTMTEKLSQ